tara:strand:+ start:629 stop:832 length:204 start_codon:yes stop_codon:yes gene_type:complete
MTLTGYGDIRESDSYKELPSGLPIIHHSWDSAMIAVSLVDRFAPDSKEYLSSILQVVPTHGGKITYT